MPSSPPPPSVPLEQLAPRLAVKIALAKKQVRTKRRIGGLPYRWRSPRALHIEYQNPRHKCASTYRAPHGTSKSNSPSSSSVPSDVDVTRTRTAHSPGISKRTPTSNVPGATSSIDMASCTSPIDGISDFAVIVAPP